LAELCVAVARVNSLTDFKVWGLPTLVASVFLRCFLARKLDLHWHWHSPPCLVLQIIFAGVDLPPDGRRALETLGSIGDRDIQ
jgi:hypothetical protein